MFDFLKKKTDNNVYAPVKGLCIDISEVKDEAFASKLMGDGVAVIPDEGTVTAPADGKITMMFDTGHAFGIKTDNGMELLIHIGIDTVNLNGKGFHILKKSGEKVKKGEPMVEVDLEDLRKDYDMTTMVIVTNGEPFQKPTLQKMVDQDVPIIEGNR